MLFHGSAERSALGRFADLGIAACLVNQRTPLPVAAVLAILVSRPR